MTKGTIRQIIGAVVDVEFPEGQLPEIYNAIQVPREGKDPVVMEAMQHLGNDEVRCVDPKTGKRVNRKVEQLDTAERAYLTVDTRKSK